jgi:hypothetical protein
LDGDDFDVGGDVVFTAEVEHLLGFGDAPYERAREASAGEDQREGGDGEGFFGCAYESEVAVAAQEIEEGVDVVVGGDAVEDEVETAGVLGHFVGIFRDDDFVGAEAESIIFFVGRGGEEDGVGSESVSEFDAHVAESAESDDADFFALRDSPMMHGGVGGNAGAEERRGSGEVEIGGDFEDEVLGDDDAVGVAAVGDASGVLVWEVVGEDHVGAELFQASFALGTGAIGVDHTAYGSEVAYFEFGYSGADLGDAADDLVTGDAGIDSGHDAAPLVAGLMEVGVTDAAEEDLNLHITLGWIAPRDRGGCKRRFLTGSGVGFCVVHGSNLDRFDELRYAERAILCAECAMRRTLATEMKG